MPKHGHRDKSSGKTDKNRDKVPAPERGSPGADPDAVTDDAAERIEKGEGRNINPLAPPINIQGGS